MGYTPQQLRDLREAHDAAAKARDRFVAANIDVDRPTVRATHHALFVAADLLDDLVRHIERDSANEEKLGQIFRGRGSEKESGGSSGS